jgi:hypothetical protein
VASLELITVCELLEYTRILICTPSRIPAKDIVLGAIDPKIAATDRVEYN